MISSCIPEYLRPGDEIRIVSPASRIEKRYIENSVKALEQLGYKISFGENVFSEFHQFAGEDSNRLADMQSALNDPDIKAIFCARGGYGSVRLIDALNFSRFEKSPKWLVGFSDITVFHAQLNTRMNIASIHSPMPVNFESAYFSSNLKQLNSLLQGTPVSIGFPNFTLNRRGIGEGKFVGGNLSILYSLQGTPFAIDTQDSILFIEDVGEQLYHLDRILNNFKLSGIFKNLKGLVVGAFTDMKDKKRPFGKTVYEIIVDYTQDYNYPVLFDFPAGHIENNLPFVLGSKIKLDVNSQGASIEYLY